MEEASFLKDASLEREKHLQKQIVTMEQELRDLPKKYIDKNEKELQLYLQLIKTSAAVQC
jgi:hypothetical protein